MESIMGKMPYVNKIYDFADNETKKKLKLSCKAFWSSHVREKFYKNFTESQEKRHRTLYCYGVCENNILFEVYFLSKPHLGTLFRIVSIPNFGQQTVEKYVNRESHGSRMVGLFILILAGKDQRRANK